VPSIIDGLFAGRAGIQSHGTGISVLADNISNANTTAFKQSRADFADLVAGNLSGGQGISTGSGSSVVGVTPILTQGTFEFTGRGLDTGIDGNGYFVVQDGGTGQRFYTRAGNFKVDTDGYLLDQNGFQVLGFSASGGGALGAMNVNDSSQGNVNTNRVDVSGNLNASASIVTTIPSNVVGTATTFSALNTIATQQDPDGGYQNTVDIFDSLGGSHTIRMYFFHTASVAGVSTWRVQAYADDTEITAGATAGSARLLASTDIQFSATGTRVAPPAGTPDFTATPTWLSGAQPVGVDFYFDPYTQFSSPSTIQNLAQDGTGTGNVVGFSIEENGNLFAQLDNGQTATIGTLGLASFANAEGLRRVGGSLLAVTGKSGVPVIGRPNSGTYGAIEAGALELSNADIASDFIKLISLQRGFQGSARVITNINDLLNEIINLA